MVFKKRSEGKKEKDLTIAGTLGKRNKTGEVGIEVECEGRALPKEGLPEQWGYVRDGSLRGADNGEYILNKPIKFDDVDKAVDDLWAKFKENGTRLDDSIRTSVHVHLNVLPFYQNRLASLLALWFIFEETLTNWCGDHRVGNLFAQRAKDSAGILTQVKNFLENKGERLNNIEGLHYSALNIASIIKYGSVEVRTLRGVTTPEPLKQWVRILRKLYDTSANYADPRTIIEEFSLKGSFDFFLHVFREEAEPLLADLKDFDIRASLFEGMRFAQEVAYTRDWSDFNPGKVVVDPFEREEKSPIARALEAAEEPREAPDTTFNRTFADLARGAGGQRVPGLIRNTRAARVTRGNPFGD